ncbi:FAD-dependent oxidoreductase [Micromonospora sp. NPDC051227]|uniref:FAD-dependent oxidoreductase n=1 Tax=Micromonospora sp. NPDC051227 TaxID=3364285 RepID=UPI00379507A6
MAGLLAARVLTDAYDEVTIVDRDELAGSGARRGVPQGRHVHGLLARGQQILDELFPGFTARAVAAGVPTGDLGELRWFFNGRPLRRASTGLVCVSGSRPLLEAQVRDAVAALPGLRLRDGCDIVGLVTTEDRSRITGVRVHPAGAADEEVIPADLVVDATGRGSRAPVWLAELGYRRPAETRVPIDLVYTTRHYRLRDEGILHGDLSINPVSTPSHPRGAFFSRIQDGRSVLSLTGVLGDHPPADERGFLDFVRSLPVPDIFDVIRDAEPLDDPVSFRYPASVRRHYERLDRLPAGFLVLGDALCSFNPVYGQGMTVAALEALTLREHLRTGLAPRPGEFFRDAARVVDVPWDISAGSDLSFPGVVGPRPPKVRIANAYMSRVQAAAVRDGAVTRSFMRVAGLVDPPTDLMRPRMMWRVLTQARGVAPAPARPVEQTTVGD